MKQKLDKDIQRIVKRLEKQVKQGKPVELNLSDEIFLEKLHQNKLTQITASLSPEKSTTKDQKIITYPKILQDI